MVKTRTGRESAERIKWCARREYQIPLIACLKCRHFPCGGITDEDSRALEESRHSERVFDGLKQRRSKLYIFKYMDGGLRIAPDGFSPDNPDLNMLNNVNEIYAISKTFVKQTRLVVKERKDISADRQKRSRDKNPA